MKRIIFTLIALASIFGVKAELTEKDYDFKVNYGYDNNPKWIYFQWVDREAKTCRTIPAPYYKIERFVNFNENNATNLYGYIENSLVDYYPVLTSSDPSKRTDWPEGPNDYVNEFVNGVFPIGDDGLVEYEPDKFATLVEIGDFSFCECYNGPTDNIKIPSTVKRIGKGAFITFQNKSANIDFSNVEIIDDFAFYGYKFELNLPTNLKYLGENIGLFTNTSLEFDNPELEIAPYAFVKTDHKFDQIIIKSLKTIGECAFDGIEIDELYVSNLNTIAERAFASSGKSTLPKIVIGEGVVNIEKDAFISRHVQSVTLGEDLEYIGKGAFFKCDALEELTIPDKVKKIDDYAFFDCHAICPLRFGKLVEHIGAFAFCNANYNCESKIVLHSKLNFVGPGAFYFNKSAKGQKNGESWEDLYVYAKEPPTMDFYKDIVLPDGQKDDVIGFSGFGDFFEEVDAQKYDRQEFWCYPYVCLHVPKGSYTKYKEHPEWSKFQCIIEDLMPEDSFTEDEDGSIQKHVGYVFLSLEPNVDSKDYKEYPLTKDLFSSNNFKDKATLNVDTWEIYDLEDNENDYIVNLIKRQKSADVETVVDGEDGSNEQLEDFDWFIKPNHYGQKLILGYNTKDNHSWNGNTMVGEKSLVGAVMVFVCPTVTLVYDEVQKAQESAEKVLRKISEEEEDNTSASESTAYDDAVTEYSSYQHRAIYNSYPKYGLQAATGITIETIEKAHFDEDGKYTNGYSDFDNVKDDQLVGEGSDTSNEGGYIVPLNAITENRVIKLSSEINNEDREEIVTSVNEVEISDRISVSTAGLQLTINGADENAVVRVFDTKGNLLKKTTDKTMTLPYAGVYIIKVEDVAFKALVN